MGGSGAPDGTVPPSITVTVIVGMGWSLPSSLSLLCVDTGTGFDVVEAHVGMIVPLGADEGGGTTLLVVVGAVTVIKTVLTTVVMEPPSLLAGGGGSSDVEG